VPCAKPRALEWCREEGMNQRFKELVDTLDAKCQQLLAMPPLIASEVPRRGTPIGGIYLFSEPGQHLYAGRTKRVIGVRIRNHFGANPNAATFAWLIASTRVRVRYACVPSPDTAHRPFADGAIVMLPRLH